MATSIFAQTNYLPVPDDLRPPDDPTLFETFNAQIKHQYAPLAYTLHNYIQLIIHRNALRASVPYGT